MVDSLIVETTALTNHLIKSEERSGIRLLSDCTNERLLIVRLAATCS